MIQIDCVNIHDLVHFKFVLRSRITFLTGATASGKSYFNELVNVSQLYLPKSSSLTLIPGQQFLGRYMDGLDEDHVYVCIFDEDAELIIKYIVDAYLKYRNLWFVFMRRELLGYQDFKVNKLLRSELMYSIRDLVKFSIEDCEILDLSPYGLEGTVPVFEISTLPMLSIESLSGLNSSPKCCVTEDSASGYKLIKRFSPTPVSTLRGRGNLRTLYRKLSKKYPDWALAFDLANMSGMTEKLLDMSSHIKLWNYPSFEGLLLNIVFEADYEDLWITEGGLLERELTAKVQAKLNLDSDRDVKSCDYSALLTHNQLQLVRDWLISWIGSSPEECNGRTSHFQ